MNKELQEIRDLEREHQDKWCNKVAAFMKNNFPVGSKISKDGKEYEVTGYEISYHRPSYLIVSEIIREERAISLYDLEELVEKKGGGQCH